MELTESSTAISISKEKFINNHDPMSGTREYIERYKGRSFCSLASIAKDTGIPVSEVMETLVRLYYEGTIIHPFIMMNCLLEVDEWADDTGRRITRIDLEHASGATDTIAETESFQGFLEIHIANVHKLLDKESVRIKLLWESIDAYVAFATTKDINHSHIYVLNTEKAELISELTGRKDSVVSTDLLKLIHEKYRSNPANLIDYLEDLEEKYGELEVEAAGLREEFAKKKGSTKDLLIAGLTAALVEKANSDRGNSYKLTGGKLNTGEIILDITERLKLDENESGTSDFKNQIPRLYRKHADNKD